MMKKGACYEVGGRITKWHRMKKLHGTKVAEKWHNDIWWKRCMGRNWRENDKMTYGEKGAWGKNNNGLRTAVIGLRCLLLLQQGLHRKKDYVCFVYVVWVTTRPCMVNAFPCPKLKWEKNNDLKFNLFYKRMSPLKFLYFPFILDVLRTIQYSSKE